MKVAVIANTEKEGIKTLLPVFVESMNKNGADVILNENLRAVLDSDYDFRPETDIEIQFFSNFGFPTRFQREPVFVVKNIPDFHMISSIERSKISIFGKLEGNSDLDIFEVRIGISDVQEAAMMCDFQAHKR